MVSELGRMVPMTQAPTTLALKNSGGQSVLPQYSGGDALVHRGMALRSSSDSSSQTVTAKYGLYDAQREFESAGILPVDEKLRGGVQPRCGNVLQMAQSVVVLNPYSGDGSGLSKAKYVYDHWIELGAM